MKLFALALALFSAASTAHASLLNCSGYKIVDSAGTALKYDFAVNRLGFDEKPGMPVSIVIFNTLESNTAPMPEVSKVFLKCEGRMFSVGRGGNGFLVQFIGGSLEVYPGNTGITGTRHALDGKLNLDRVGTIQVSCPLN